MFELSQFSVISAEAMLETTNNGGYGPGTNVARRELLSPPHVRFTVKTRWDEDQ